MPSRVERWRPVRMQRHTIQHEQAHYRTADWKARRIRILTRDAYTCAVCRRVVSGRAAHVDHIVPLEDGGTDDDANLQTLCSEDHGVKTREEQRRRGYLP